MPTKTKPKKHTAARKPAAPRRTRRSREEGQQLLLQAAQTLLATQHPDEIGIRDIGAVAHVHHRFVMEWFGGKVALFRAVHDSRALDLSLIIAGTTDFHDKKIGRAVESIRHEIELVNWLIVNGSFFESIEAAFPSLAATKIFLMNTLGLSEEEANKSAQVIGSIVIADAMLRPHLVTEFTQFELIVHYIESLTNKRK